MNIKKILASVAAAALAVSAMGVAAFAADIDLGAGSPVEFNADALAALADADTTVTIDYNSPNGWEDIGIGGKGGELGDWAGVNFQAEKGEGTLVLTVAEIAAKFEVESLAGVTDLKIEGYNDTEILGVVVTTAGEGEEGGNEGEEDGNEGEEGGNEGEEGGNEGEEGGNEGEEGGNEGEEGNTEDKTEDKNEPVNTGAVLMVIPAVVAAAGVIVSRKRK